MENSNNWIDDAFNSVKHQKQATPAADLFSKIELKINEPGAKVISLLNWKIAVAASIILMINIFAIQKINSNKMETDVNGYELIQDFNIYAK